MSPLAAPRAPERAPASPTPSERVDVAVIGAGFGGLAAALSLAESGRSVALFETLDDPGGCAGTFERGGARHQAGATLPSGLGPGQLFDLWRARHGLELDLRPLDPVIELRGAPGRIRYGPTRERTLEGLRSLPGAPRASLEAFFSLQERVADRLWPLVDRPDLLPPLHGGALLRLLRSAPGLLGLAPLVGRPLGPLVERLGLAGFRPFTLWLEASCQITVQCGWREAEAPLALAALDHAHRGAVHVAGGIGALARELARAAQRRGVSVRLSDRVRALRPTGAGWRVDARRGAVEARAVVANLLPQGLRRLVGAEPGRIPALDRLAERVGRSWGACTLYLLARAPAGDDGSARHLELVDDDARPLVEGNHVLASISAAGDGLGRGELRSITVSTHVRMEGWRALPDSARAERVAAIQERMRRTLARRAPEWAAGVVEDLPGSPRTFERFTGRELGLVGGVPRRAGLAGYRGLVPRPVLPGLWLVGDSVPPGQGTLAVAIGGACTARAVERSLGSRRAGRGRGA